MKKSIWYRYGFMWVTLGFFLVSVIGHWMFAWFAFESEQQAHNQEISVKDYIIEVSRDTLENWQSEFLQLLWQVAGLTYLLYLGSPQSKDGDERLEEKIDEILKTVNSKSGEIIQGIERRHPKV